MDLMNFRVERAQSLIEMSKQITPKVEVVNYRQAMQNCKP